MVGTGNDHVTAARCNRRASRENGESQQVTYVTVSPSLLVWLDGPRGILKIYVFYSKLTWQCDTWCFIPITDNKTSWSEQGLGAGAPD